MIIKQNGEVLKTESKFQSFMYSDNIKVYWNGFVFLQDSAAGIESIQKIVDSYLQNKQIGFESIFGSYTIVLVHKDIVFAFSDNSNMHCLYNGQTCIGSECIELALFMKEKGNKLTINDRAVFQHFAYGKIYEQCTYVNEIGIIKSNQYVYFHNGEIAIKDKNIGDISKASRQKSLSDFLETVGKSIAQEKISCALTGGYDSRMITAVLSKDIKLDSTICGDNEKDGDIRISKEVSAAAGTNYVRIPSKKPCVDEDYIHRLFELSDGMEMYIDENRFRWIQYVDFLEKQEYTVCLSGDGGVLHKDWEWKQDFPFYRKKKVDIKRYYKQRIACSTSFTYAGERLLGLRESHEEWMIEQLCLLKKQLNTESYDMFYNYMNGNRRFEYNICNGRNLFYAPLQELEAVRSSFHLPRKTRWFNNQLREITTQANKEVAKIPTNYGMTASSEWKYMIRDVWFDIKYTAKRGVRLIYRKVTKKTIGEQKASTWTCIKDLREAEVTKHAIQYAQRNGYLCDNVSPEELTNRKIGAMLYLYYWSQLISE